MSNYSVLKQDINNNIYENQTQQITGTVLNAILNEMTASLGAGYQFAGVATLGMNPADPDQRVFYLAGEGIYTNFGGIQVPAGKLGVLKWDNRWTLQTIDGLGGGGANLTGYVTVASTDDLPDEGVATLGYLCGTNLYLYVGEGGDTKEGKYQNCGSFRGPQGDSVQDVEQTQTSLENGGVNKIKFTLSNGISCEFQVRNGTTSSGLFPTLEALQAAYPSPVVGQYAFVGAGFPADIYVCTTAGTWTDSGEDYDGDNVDLTDYATKAEVNQLEAKVDDYWKMPDTQIPVTTVGAHSTNGSYTDTVLAKSGAMCTNIAVSPGQKYKIYGTSDSSTWYRCCAVFKEDGTKLITAPSGNYTVTPYEVTIPSDGAKMTINLISYNSATDKALLVGESYNAQILQSEIEENNNEYVPVALNFERAVKMKADRYSSVLADWMQVVSDGAAQNNNTIMSVVSSTSSTITLSAEDAAQFVVKGPSVVHFANGDCKMLYFDVPVGSTITEVAGQDIDLTGADYIQNLHDTARGGAGIHLSQLGYIMLAQFTAQEVASKMSQKDSNLLASVMMYNSSESTDKKAIKDVNGNVCATVETDFVNTGQTPNGNGLLATYGIVSNDQVNANYCGYLYQAFRFQQGVKDNHITFTLQATGKGFLEVECGKSPRKTTSTGTATMQVYADGTLVDSVTVKNFYHRFQFSSVSAKRNISVKFIIDANADTEVGIYSINLWAMDDIVPSINLNGKKVAVLGDSWTQFPGLANAIPLYPDYNTVGTRPDGTELDGLAYFVKEFARVTGAACDNWGKSNMRADNWGLEKIDTILAFKQYDYLIIEFFTNDVNASITADAWAANIALIAEKCKRACVRPIIALPCRNNGGTVNPLGVYHETALRGLGMM